MSAAVQPASAAGRAPLKSLDDALAELITLAQPLTDQEDVALFAADGRVLAQDLVSPLQVPPQDNSSMDGYLSLIHISEPTRPY